MHPIRAGRIPCVADKNFAAQIRAGRNDHTLCAVLTVQLGHDALDVPILDLDRDDLCLMDGKPGRQLQRMFHIFVIPLAVGLDPQGMDCRAFALVEHPALQIGRIGGQTHHAAQCIQLPDQRSLGRSANAGIAGHIADGIQTHGEHRRFCAQRCGSVGGFNARMARADHDDVIIS